MIITIDGPSASGKGSLARDIANHFGYYYLDTGSLYRAIGVIASRSFPQQQIAAGRVFTEELLAEWVAQLRYTYAQGVVTIFFKEEDISPLLRALQSDWYASQVSKILLVRESIGEFQRALGRERSLVADGRDCGTFIFPGAQHKFFLTASIEVRARRVVADPVRHATDYNEVFTALLQRDLRDGTRTIRPLCPAPDAHIIDNSLLTQAQTCALVLAKIQGAR